MSPVLAAGLTLVGVSLIALWAVKQAPTIISSLRRSPDDEILRRVGLLQADQDVLRRRVGQLTEEMEDVARRAENSAKRSHYHAERAQAFRAGGGEGEEPVGDGRGDAPAGSNGRVSPVYQDMGEASELAELRRQIAFL